MECPHARETCDGCMREVHARCPVPRVLLLLRCCSWRCSDAARESVWLCGVCESDERERERVRGRDLQSCVRSSGRAHNRRAERRRSERSGGERDVRSACACPWRWLIRLIAHPPGRALSLSCRVNIIILRGFRWAAASCVETHRRRSADCVEILQPTHAQCIQSTEIRVRDGLLEIGV